MIGSLLWQRLDILGCVRNGRSCRHDGYFSHAQLSFCFRYGIAPVQPHCYWLWRIDQMCKCYKVVKVKIPHASVGFLVLGMFTDLLLFRRIFSNSSTSPQTKGAADSRLLAARMTMTRWKTLQNIFISHYSPLRVLTHDSTVQTPIGRPISGVCTTMSM